MSGDAIATAVVLLVMFALLAADRFPPSGVLLAGLSTLVLGGIVDVDAGFAGFSNQAPLTVAALYVVAAGARRTGLLTGITARVLGGTGGRTSLARLCTPVAGLSTVFNNTPLVAMLMPEVSAWARSRRLPASRFLMPLSFAAILGGTVTLIGTSTNLVVSGVLEQQGREPFGLFELTPVGLPVALVGLAVLIGIAATWIPDRTDPAARAVTAMREYALHLEVEPASALVGRSVSDAGLRNLSGVYLADIIRGDRHLGPVDPDEVLDGGDVLIFVGDVTDVIDLRSRPGLRAPQDQADVVASSRAPRYFEAVVGRESPLVGRTLKEVGGRTGYRAAAPSPSTAPAPPSRASSATSSSTLATPSCSSPAATSAPPDAQSRTSSSSHPSTTPFPSSTAAPDGSPSPSPPSSPAPASSSPPPSKRRSSPPASSSAPESSRSPKPSAASTSTSS